MCFRTLSSSEDNKFASPLPLDRSPVEPGITRKRPGLRSSSGSPKWETNNGSDGETETKSSARKKLKTYHNESMVLGEKSQSDDKNNDYINKSAELAQYKSQYVDQNTEINNKGDGVTDKTKRKNILVTPPNKELGQGDCHPSTSESMSDISHTHLNAQLPRKAVECNGYVEFTRTRNSRSVDSMKWERKCKVQISYSEDPLNVGEYIIWAIHYSDESKCRRNLLAEFENVDKDD